MYGKQKLVVYLKKSVRGNNMSVKMFKYGFVFVCIGV